MRIGIAVIWASAALAQPAAERVLEFSHTPTAEARSEMAAAIRAVTVNTQLTVEEAGESLRLLGPTAAIEAAEWVFQRLDRKRLYPADSGSPHDEFLIPGSSDERVAIFYRQKVLPAEAVTQIVNLVRAAGNIRSAAGFRSGQVVIVRAGAANVKIASWLLDRLDSPGKADETISALGLGLPGAAAEDQILRVLYAAKDPPVLAMNEVDNAVLNVLGPMIGFPSHSPEALVVRSQASRVEAATWLFHELDHPAGGGERQVHEYRFDGGDRVVRVFYVPGDLAALRDMSTAIRGAAGGALFLFVCPIRGALVLQGTADRMEKAARTVEGKGTSALAPAAVPTAFDVASVKPRSADTSNPTIQFRPDEVAFHNVMLSGIIASAYSLPFGDSLSGPDWLRTEKYDVEAKAASPVPQEQLRKMLQTLLAERFHLATHHEARVFQGYALVIAKSGLKFKPVKPEPGVTKLPRAVRSNRMTDKDAPVQYLLADLSGALHCPVVDETHIEAVFDFDLRFTPDGPQAADPGTPASAGVPAPSLFDALEQQLGLRLEKRKITVDVLVVDHADRVPTGN